MKQDLYREDSMKKLLAGEDDTIAAYVKNITIKSWVMITAVFLISISFFIWILTSTVTNKIEVIGLSKEDQFLIFLTPEECIGITVGKQAKLEEKYDANIIEISDIEYSKNEVRDMLSRDYYKSNVTINEWNKIVVLSCENKEMYQQKLVRISIDKEKIKLSDYFTN